MKTSPQPETMQELQTLITKRFVVPLLAKTPNNDWETRQTLKDFTTEEQQIILRALDETGQRHLLNSPGEAVDRLKSIALEIVQAFKDSHIPTVSIDSFIRSTIEIEGDWYHSESQFWTTKRATRSQGATVVIHGPPGAGKSTLITLAPQRTGIQTIDTETLGDTLDEIREGYLSLAPTPPGTIRLCTSAHLFREFGVDAYRIVILPPLKIYIDRFQGRNLSNPQKNFQGEMRSYAKWLGRRNFADLVIEQPISPEETLAMIYKFIENIP